MRIFYIIKKEKGNPIKIYKKIKSYNKINSMNLFDEKYYLNNYPHVRNSNIDPLNHYIYYGYKEKMIPSENFDGNYYLGKFSDVRKSGENPLIHYVLYGKEENRFPTEKKEKKSPKNKINSLNKNILKQKAEISKYKKEIKLIRKKIEKEVDYKKNESYLIKRELKNVKKELTEVKKELKKYNDLYSLNSINKEQISSYIENFSGYGLTKETRNKKIIVSLTSFPERMYDIHYCLFSLLTQTLKPDKIVLWLSKEEFPNLEKDIPKKVINLKKYGLTISWSDKDYKSYNKLVDSLRKYPEDIIVTADDDVFYPDNWLKKLYDNFDNENIVCHRGHFVKFDNNKFKPYKDWLKCIQNKKYSFLNFGTGVGGILYPPKVLYKDVLNEELFENLAPTGDDIWFWAMSVLNNAKIKIIDNGYTNLNYINPKRELNFLKEKTLFSKNIMGSNDKQLEKVLNHYPELKDKLNNDSFPKVSVIIPVFNVEKYLEQCLDSIINQTLNDIEIICINDGSTDNSLKILKRYNEKDKRIKIINQKNKGLSIARNNGLKIAKGKYISFVDSDDWVDLNFLEKLYDKAMAYGADLVRTTYVYNFPNSEKRSEINNILISKENEELSVNDHSVVVWNAIYRRKYLENNNINYFDNFISEDIPFTARATYFSKKSLSVAGTYYHYRKNKNNTTSSINNIKKLLSRKKSNKITLDFINNVKYNNEIEYLTAFERCITRYDNIFKEGLKIQNFDENLQKEFFNEFSEEFKKCKNINRLNKEFFKNYYTFLNENSFDEYISWVKD